MAGVHQLILTHGIDSARRQAASKRERQVVEAAYAVLSEDADRIGFTYSGFALTSLPHKNTEAASWKREGHNLTLLLESGKDVHTGRSIGIPHGSYARFILLFLQTEAIKKSSREVELGRSMHVWMGSMGLSIGGATYRKVSEQARRISACRLTFVRTAGGIDVRHNGGFVQTAITMTSLEDRQATLWNDKVVLDEIFYKELREHPVPISESALRAIGPRSLVIDLYIWLAYRLHSLKGTVDIGWPMLQSQFGAGYVRARRFREYFLECLELAMAAYPDARVTMGDRGLMLHPSRPAVPKLA
jgi:hypothetical protein